MQLFHEEAAHDTERAQWGLRIFIARWPGADVLPMPTLRQQLATHRRDMQANAHAFEALFAAAASPAPPGTLGEHTLDYYRHDIDLSDHHLHWHSLYPWASAKDDARQRTIQGRLFLYMHQQMLARYDTERYSVGLPPVEPFLEWDKPATWRARFEATNLPTDPLAPWIGPAWIKDRQPFAPFDDRGKSPGELSRDQNGNDSSLSAVIAGLQAVHDGINNRTYKTYNDVGADLEASAQTNPSEEAGPHNMGHVVLSACPLPSENNVMLATEVAMTTPIFYRWHRAIDDFGFAWQETMGLDPTTYLAPPIRIRKGNGAAAGSPDVILTPRSAIDGIDGVGFDLDKWGQTKFGDFGSQPASDLNASVLETALLNDPDIPGSNFLKIQTDWVYFVRLQNDSSDDLPVTVRIWLAAEALSNNRRNWIEMDKFAATVPARTQHVAARPSWHSSVIRRKSVDDPMTLAETKDEFNDLTSRQPAESMWCECGLPYRLLLPRGTPDGMPCRFLVLVTDGGEDGTANEHDEHCGSVQFCGKTNRDWPDTKEMGFPFDRHFGSDPHGDPIKAHFDRLPNAVWREVTIKSTVRS
jgi:hypothetical protein